MLLNFFLATRKAHRSTNYLFGNYVLTRLRLSACGIMEGPYLPRLDTEFLQIPAPEPRLTTTRSSMMHYINMNNALSKIVACFFL